MKQGQDALHFAVQHGMEEKVHLLLGAGAKVEERHLLAGGTFLQTQGWTKRQILHFLVTVHAK